jgi:tetratricopeptide (TPR) repeat protein
MHRTRRTIAWLLVLILVVPALATAARKGRLIGKVCDPEGTPIQGVTVVATCEALPDFREVDTTDKKGVFKFDFEELFVVYRLRFEKDGYHTLESEQTWRLEGTARDEFTMYPGETMVDTVALVSGSNQAIDAHNEGVEAFNAGDWATAEAKFEEALGHDPELHQSWGGLSRTYLRQERWEKSVEAAEKAIALGATDGVVYRARWEAYRGLGDEEKAAAALHDLEQADLRVEEAKRIYNEGVAFSDGGDQEGAFAKFEEALRLNPNFEEAMIGVATVGLEIGRNEEAVAAAEAILNANPQHEQALRIRYNAALKTADEGMIIDALVSLAAVEPVIARDGLLRLAYEAYDANDMPLAKERFGKVLEVDPDQPHAHYVLALIHVNDGANEEAKKHLERFLAIAPDDQEAATARDLLDYLGGP